MATWNIKSGDGRYYMGDHPDTSEPIFSESKCGGLPMTFDEAETMMAGLCRQGYVVIMVSAGGYEAPSIIDSIALLISVIREIKSMPFDTPPENRPTRSTPQMPPPSAAQADPDAGAYHDFVYLRPVGRRLLRVKPFGRRAPRRVLFVVL